MFTLFLICRYVIPLLLLLSPTICSPAVPFYCRRFKGNCSVRRESICCREENIAATAAAAATVEPVAVEESVEIIDTGDNLLASSSFIEEVVVAPDEPPVSLIFVNILFKVFPIAVAEFAESLYNNSQARQASTKVLPVTKV